MHGLLYSFCMVFSFNLDGWKLMIGYTLFSVGDDERALHPLACGLICFMLQLIVAFVDTGPGSLFPLSA